jgi:hypothetical protein
MEVNKMGTIQNDAIIVTGYKEEILNAHKKAMEIFNADYDGHQEINLVSPRINHVINCDETFIVSPDGSKEGWDMSDEFNRRRNLYISYLKSRGYHLDWVYISYGEIKYQLMDSSENLENEEAED